MEILREMGCLEQVLAKTDRIDSLFCQTASGKVLLNLKYKDLGAELFGAGTQRAAFLEILLDQCRNSQVKIEWDCDVTSLERQGDKREVKSAEKTLGAFDLVVVSDGAKSSLRRHLNIPQKVSVYPWGALWFIGQRSKEFSSNQLWQVVNGASQLSGFLPTGINQSQLSLFYSLKISNYQEFLSIPLDQWKTNLLKIAPQAEGFLEQIQQHNQLSVAAYHDVVMPYWHDEAAVVLGDAAHALSPQLGQGVNLALQDAATLADCIASSPTLPEALRAYSIARKKQLRFYQFATRSITPLFQSDSPFLGKVRDLSFPLATKSKWVRRQMALSMAGYKDGLLSSKAIKM